MTALAEKCDAIGNWLQGIADVLWGMPFIIFVICVGLYYVIGSGFFSFRYFGHTMKYTIRRAIAKRPDALARLRLPASRLEALSVEPISPASRPLLQLEALERFSGCGCGPYAA